MRRSIAQIGFAVAESVGGRLLPTLAQHLLDREEKEAASFQTRTRAGEHGLQIAMIDQRIRRDDEIVGTPRLRQRRLEIILDECGVDAAAARRFYHAR